VRAPLRSLRYARAAESRCNAQRACNCRSPARTRRKSAFKVYKRGIQREREREREREGRRKRGLHDSDDTCAINHIAERRLQGSCKVKFDVRRWQSCETRNRPVSLLNPRASNLEAVSRYKSGFYEHAYNIVRPLVCLIEWQCKLRETRRAT